MNKKSQDKRMYRDSEPEFYEYLGSLLEAGLYELEENGQRYRVTRDPSEDWVRYFDLQTFGAPQLHR